MGLLLFVLLMDTHRASLPHSHVGPTSAQHCCQLQATALRDARQHPDTPLQLLVHKQAGSQPLPQAVVATALELQEDTARSRCWKRCQSYLHTLHK